MRLADKKLCTGCGACEIACKSSALNMTADSKGFWHPEVDSTLCTDCKRCEKVCPVINEKIERYETEQVYAVSIKDKTVENDSSSGGAFSALAKIILENGGVVYAAGYDENFNVEHIRIEEYEELFKVRGSKYVQSCALSAVREVADELLNGKTVMFAGTPCQIAALKSVVPYEAQENLFTVDFICHGVTSPELFEKYKEFIGKGKKITSLSFRDKTEGWRKYSIKMEFSDGSEYRRRVVDDPFMIGYAQNISVRRSCTNCRFLGTSRVSDITMGDAWSQTFSSEKLSDGRGVSLVLLNTEKGKVIFDRAKDDTYTEKLSLDVLKEIRPLNISTPFNPLTDKYYNDMKKLEFNKLCEKYCGASVISKLRRFAAKKFIGMEK